MSILDPGKLLVLLVLVLVLVGPDKLPGVARQMGAAWSTLRKFQERIESEVRETMPDLPSTAHIAKAVRSPVSFLNSLADMESPGGTTPATPQASAPSSMTSGPSPVLPNGGGAKHVVRSMDGASGPLVVPEDPGMN